MTPSLTSRLAMRLARAMERRRPWNERHWLPGLLVLYGLREELRLRNLHDTAPLPAPEPTAPVAEPPAGDPLARDQLGQYNDPANPRMGAAYTRFGRNMAPAASRPEPEPGLLEPSPRVVSERLLARGHDRMIEAGILNLHAAAWIQFMIHDWVSHGPGKPGEHIEIPLAADDPWPQKPMQVLRTPPDPTRTADGGPPAFLNTETHWWDGSQVYGSDPRVTARLRDPSGRLRLDGGFLPRAADGADDSGIVGNWWLGLGILHTLFAREHNAIADALVAADPALAERPDRLFDKARLVNAALMAKIHTIEWTPAILPLKTTTKAMQGNWSGLFGPRWARRLRRVTRADWLIGIPGSRPDHHGAGYTLTEEFVAVYRLHPLIPDRFDLYRYPDPGAPVDQVSMRAVTGIGARATLHDLGMRDACFSFGVRSPGALRLHNFPETLRELERKHHRMIDLAAVDVLRDRERGVPRYNEFRRQLRMRPARDFMDLIGGDPRRPEDRRQADELAEVYGDIERVDLMVGLYAEPLLEGFGFSETAFRIFVLMASRRLKSDRFFTDDYRPEVYTERGMRWVEEETMTSVIARHVPELAPLMRDVRNAFAPWTDPANRRTGVPPPAVVPG